MKSMVAADLHWILLLKLELFNFKVPMELIFTLCHMFFLENIIFFLCEAQVLIRMKRCLIEGLKSYK